MSEMRRYPRMERGVTLVELMISTAIVAGISLALASVFRASQRSMQARESSMSVSFELRRGMQAMTRELAQTMGQWLLGPNGAAFPSDGNAYASVTFRVPQDLNGDGTVLDSGGLVEWSDPITYSLGGLNGRQIRRSQGGAVRVLANGVTGLTFRRQAAAPLILQVNLTVQHSAAGDRFIQQADLSTRVRLRN